MNDTSIYSKKLLKKIHQKRIELESIRLVISKYEPVISKTILEKYHALFNQQGIDINDYDQFIASLTKPVEKNSGDVLFSIDNNVREVYKQLVLRTHSDKNPGNENNHNEDFIKIKEAYDKDDYLTLMKYASQYEIISDNSDIQQIVFLERELAALKQKINALKNEPQYLVIINNNFDALIKIWNQNIALYKQQLQMKQEIAKLTKEISTKKDIYT